MPLTPANIPPFFTRRVVMETGLHIFEQGYVNDGKAVVGVWDTELLREYDVLASVYHLGRPLLVLGKKDETLPVAKNPYLQDSRLKPRYRPVLPEGSTEAWTYVPKTYTPYKRLYLFSVVLHLNGLQKNPLSQSEGFMPVPDGLHVTTDVRTLESLDVQVARTRQAIRVVIVSVSEASDTLNYYGSVSWSAKSLMTLLCHLKQHGFDKFAATAQLPELRIPHALTWSLYCYHSGQALSAPKRRPMFKVGPVERTPPPQRPGPQRYGQRW